MVPSALIVTAPLVTGTSGHGTRAWQRLTGTTSQSSTELDEGCYHTLQVGATAVRVRWTASAGTAVTTDWYLPAGARVDWTTDGITKFVNAIAADGTSSFEVFVAASSGRGV
jgi:hypothetical protein